MIKVEAGREHFARSGQNDSTVFELGFEAIKRGMKIGEEGGILRIDPVGVHRDESDVIVPAIDSPGHESTPSWFAAGPSTRVPLSLSVELEYALRVAGEECDFCRLTKIEIFETRQAFARRPKWWFENLRVDARVWFSLARE
jgi:hypothetical protein